jgi:hypothetical protein
MGMADSCGMAFFECPHTASIIVLTDGDERTWKESLHWQAFSAQK